MISFLIDDLIHVSKLIPIGDRFCLTAALFNVMNERTIKSVVLGNHANLLYSPFFSPTLKETD